MISEQMVEKWMNGIEKKFQEESKQFKIGIDNLYTLLKQQEEFNNGMEEELDDIHRTLTQVMRIQGNCLESENLRLRNQVRTLKERFKKYVKFK